MTIFSFLRMRKFIVYWKSESLIDFIIKLNRNLLHKKWWDKTYSERGSGCSGLSPLGINFLHFYDREKERLARKIKCFSVHVTGLPGEGVPSSYIRQCVSTSLPIITFTKFILAIIFFVIIKNIRPNLIVMLETSIWNWTTKI